MAEGRFTIPTRIYLTAGQRAQLEQLLRNDERELDELLSDLLTAYLDEWPEPPAEQAKAVGATGSEELRYRRQELHWLRPRLNDPHNPAPAWLVQMVADLEGEIARLEQLEARPEA